MKVGVISDVHGNYTALDVVLDDMPSVDAVVSLGDVVGYGPEPSECVGRVREETVESLYGNHEMFLKNPLQCGGNTGAYKGVLHAKESLSDEQYGWAIDRPFQTTVDDTFWCVHGHPNEATPFKYVKQSNVTDMIPYLQDTDCEMLAVGHSHVQFKQDLRKFEEGSGIVFNPGSVGQPRDKNPKAGYAIVDTDTTSVELHRVEYDVEDTISKIEDAGLPSQNGERLRYGRYPSQR